MPSTSYGWRMKIENMKSPKTRKILKVIFIISMLPHIATLVYGIVCIFIGLSWIGASVHYGMDNFFFIVIAVWYLFYPLLIPLTVFQIIYLLMLYRNRKRGT